MKNFPSQFESTCMVFTEITWEDLDRVHKLHSIPEVDEFNTLGIPMNIDITREIIRRQLKISPMTCVIFIPGLSGIKNQANS